MKKSTKSNPSSVPVQHSHTDTSAANPARETRKTPCTDFSPLTNGGDYIGTLCATCGETKDKHPTIDHRLPIDPEARKANRTLPTAKVVEKLATIPTAARCAQVVGAWVWVQFAEQPAAEIRQQLSQLGFHWNANRQAWQHPCGKFSTSAKASDPRDTYTSKPAVEAYA